MTTDTTWAELPPSVDLPDTDPTPEDKRPEDEKTCPVCELPIIRDPSWKRMRKYHPDCAPKAKTGEKRITTGGKAEKEADRCEQILKGFFVKGALIISGFDRYTAFCIMVNTPPVCANFRAVCLRYADLRKEFLRVPEGGSVFGLLFSVMLMVLPIAAHFGFLGKKRVAQIMVAFPETFYKLQQRMAEGEAGLTALMHEQMEEMRKTRESAAERARQQAKANGEYIPAS